MRISGKDIVPGTSVGHRTEPRFCFGLDRAGRHPSLPLWPCFFLFLLLFSSDSRQRDLRRNTHRSTTRCLCHYYGVLRGTSSSTVSKCFPLPSLSCRPGASGERKRGKWLLSFLVYQSHRHRHRPGPVRSSSRRREKQECQHPMSLHG